MSKESSQPLDLDSAEQAYELLLETARASLSDLPRLPNNIVQKSLPVLQKLKAVQEGNGQVHSDQKEWVIGLTDLLTEIVSVSLSDKPRMPDNIAQRCLKLADKIKDWLESKADRSSDQDFNATEPTGQGRSSQALLENLQDDLKHQQEESKQPNAPEWQQVFNLLDGVKKILDRLLR